MDDGKPRERIEIELTEHADTSGGRWRRARHSEPPSTSGAASTDVPGAPPPDALVVTGPPAHERHDLAAWGTERRRLIVTGLAAGVIALFIGWALGRSGGPGATAGEASGDDTPASTVPDTTDPLDGSAAPSVAPGDLPTTTRPFTPIVEQAPTTTVVEGWVDDVALVDPALAAIGLELVVLTTEGLAVVDLTTGEMSTHALTGPRNVGSPRPVYAGDDWILLVNPEGQRAQLFVGGDPRVEFPFGTNSQLFHEAGSDTFISVEQRPMMQPDETMTWNVAEIPYDGSPATTVTTYELPANAWVQTPDPAGGLIVYGQNGGVYHADVEGSQRLTTGQLLGANATTLVVSECADTLDDCHVFVTDRTTGERRSLDSPTGASPRFEATYGYWGTVLSTFSPDGQYVTVTSSGDRWKFGLLSLIDGHFVPLAEPYMDNYVSWSPDGRFALYLDRGKIAAYDTVAKTTVDDIAPIPQVVSFTTRPAN